MVDILIQAAANTKPAQAAFEKLQMQVQELNVALRQTGIAANGAVNPNGYRQMQTAMRAASSTWKDAAASSGKFYTQQLRLNSATDDFTKKLIKQKLSFSEIAKSWKIAEESYREQARIQNMFVRESASLTRSGKGVYDVAIPKQLSSELNTIGQRLTWINALVKSGSTQMINWGKNTQWAGRQLMVGFTVPTAIFGAAAGKMAYDVDMQLTRIKKVYDTTAVAVKGDTSSMAAVQKELASVTAASMDTATKAAKEYGAAITDTLGVQAELAATGLKGSALQDSTAEVMRIATLGELDYQQATTATIALQSAFKLSTKQLGEAFNFMNATENATSLSIQDIIEATPRAASAMAALGVNVEQMTVLLTSMKESGVDAAEAANALKSATGTILAPSPAADAFIKQISAGKVQVMELAQQSGGNLYNALELLYKQMEGLSDLQKQQILVKLFGKYQFNRVSAMVTNLGDAFEGTSNQTSKAMELMGESSAQLADIADRELGQFQQSASGKFKIALETLKAEMSELGKPFLEIGAIAVTVLSKMASLFNAMPDWAKYAAAIPIGLLAIAGPLVMLIGLSANMIGTLIKFINWLAIGGKAMGIVTKETKAMELASLAAKAGWDTQTQAVVSLTEQIERLTAAELAAKGAAGGVLGTNVPIATGRTASNTLGTYQKNQALAQTWQTAMATPKTVELSQYKAISGQIVEQTAKEESARSRIAGSLKGSAGYGALLAGSIATTAVSGNDFVDSLSKGAMAASTLGMMFGPWGAAVGVIGSGILMWSDHLAKIHDDAVKAQENLSTSTEQWAASADHVLRTFKGIQTASLVDPKAGQPTDPSNPESQQSITDRWNSDKMKGVVDAYKELNDTMTQNAYLENQFIDLQNRGQLSATDAAREITAMLVASGQSAQNADAMVAQLVDRIGSLDPKDLAVQVDAKINLLNTTNGDTLAQTGNDLGKTFAEAFANSADPAQSQDLVNKITGEQEKMWQNIWDKLTPMTRKAFEKQGIDSSDAFLKAWEKNRTPTDVFQPMGGSTSWANIQPLIQQMDVFNRSVTAGIADVSQLGDGYDHLSDILGDVSIKSKTNTTEQNQALATSIALGGTLGGTLDKNAEIQTLGSLRTIAMNMGLKQGTTVAEALYNIIHQIPNDLDTAATAAGGLGTALSNAYSKSFAVTGKDAKKILQDSMSSLQDSMASQASTNFENRMNASLDAAQSAWDAREKKLDYAQQDASDKFDKRWDERKKRITDYYDTRDARIDKTIKAEQKAEDIRKKIFEAEQSRLDRAAQMANSNIDINMAINTGNLDEAAKLQNDMQAQYQGWIYDDAKAALDDESKIREDKLNARKDSLDKEKDAALNNLEQQEKDAKKHFDRMQDMEKDALKRKEDADMKARKASWDHDKVAFDQRLDLFKSFTGRNIQDLEKWMKQTGFSYKDFGDNTLKPMGQDWASYFREQLHKKIQMAATDVASDNMWEEMSKQEAKAMLSGFGFKNMHQLSEFVRTGKMPQGGGPDGANKDATGEQKTPGGKVIPTPGYHVGGSVGEDKGGRLGRRGGLRNDETMAVLKHKEFVVNDKSAVANASILRDINNAKGPLPNGIMGGAGGESVMGGAGGYGPAGLGSAIMGAMMLHGIKKAVKKTYKKAKKREMSIASGGVYNVGSAGVFGNDGIGFDAEQLTNAATIASVGSKLGMSVRDIEIGIMTAITESMLRNVNYGDRDSLGLFQQRPSQGWGTEAQVTDPQYAATKFFSALKGVSDRANLSPWMAAQTVQRSGTTDGSNYQKYWDEAQAIFKTGISASGGDGKGFVAGPGGYHRPVNSGTPGPLHDTDVGFGAATDIAVPVGTTLYAVGDGVITKSYDITGYEPRRVVAGVSGDSVQDGYRSYGRVIYEKLAGGNSVLYAHLSDRAVNAGDKVKGGSVIGKTGNTGYVRSSYSNGAHLHFASADGNPLQYLKNGGETKGEGLAYLHDSETVLTKPLTKKLKQTIELFPEISDNVKNATVNAISSAFDPHVPGSQMIWANSLIGSNKKKKVGTPDPAAMSGDAVKIGTYNVKYSTPNEKTKADLGKLFTKSDVLSLTEFVKAKRDLIPWINDQGWGISGAEGANEAVVAYNKTKFKASKPGVIGINNTPGESLSGAIGTGGARKLTAAYALLSGNGTKFWQIAAHTIAHIWKNPTLNRKVQQEQFGSLGSLASRLSKDGTPVFVGGDLNNDPRAIQGSKPGGAQGMDKFKALTDAGLTTNWNPAAMKANPGGTMGGRYIDHVFSKGAKLLDTNIINGLSSDHDAVISSYNLPKLKVGGYVMSGGLAQLHDDEMVTTKPLTQDLMDGVKNFANGGGSTYNVHITANGNVNEQELARLAVREMKRMEARKPRSRTE